jgi:hypothetical protein
VAQDLKEHKIHGIGKFGWQSWLIFCRDMGGTLPKVEDATLSSFANWRKKELKKEAAAGAASEGKSEGAGGSAAEAV